MTHLVRNFDVDQLVLQELEISPTVRIMDYLILFGLVVRLMAASRMTF